MTYLRTFGQSVAQSQPTAQADLSAPTPQATPAQVPLAQEPLPPMVLVRQSNLWLSDGKGGAPRAITQLEDGAYAEYPTFSPDGSKIAFVVITPPPPTAKEPFPSAAVYIVNADGSDSRAIWKPAKGLLGIPAWTPDGQALYIATNGVEAGSAQTSNAAQLQIVRLDLKSGAQQMLLTDALDPAFSDDGKLLTYLKLNEDGYTMALHVAAPDGTGARAIMDGKDFQGFYAPRFSPDSKQIVVAAVGGPETDPQGNPIKARVPSTLDRLLGLFEPPTAEAHGLPWDLWVVNIDGTGLRRLTRFFEDLPMAVYAPDGKQIAILGAGGIYLMNADGQRLRRIDQIGAHGGLDWARR